MVLRGTVPNTFLYYFEVSPMEVKSPDDSEDHGNHIHTHEAWSRGGINLNFFTNLDQEALNMAVKDGYEENGAMGVAPSQMSLYATLPNIMGGGGGGGSPDGHGHHGPEDMVAWDPESSAVNNPLSPMGAGGGDGENVKGTYQFVSLSNLQPVGIIDLECYSAVN